MCSNCHNPVLLTDKFCESCGAKLQTNTKKGETPLTALLKIILWYFIINLIIILLFMRACQKFPG